MSSLNVPDELFQQIAQRARSQGISVEDQAVELLSKALAEDEREAELLAEIRKEREELASRGVLLTDELITEAKQWGRK